MSFNKPDNPFYTDKPLPPEKFFGREEEVLDIWERSILPVIEHGRTQTVWLNGERGIGKSSLGLYLQFLAEKEELVPIKVDLSRAHNLDDFLEKIIHSIIEYSNKNSDPISKSIKDIFQKYIDSVDVSLKLPGFGGGSIKIKTAKLKEDLPEIKRNFETFLEEFIKQIKFANKAKGLFLLFDEINGLANDPEFAACLKGLSDNLSSHASLVFMICGTEERRQAIIDKHESTNRVFDLVKNLKPIPEIEVIKYFEKTFGECGMCFEEESKSKILTYLSLFSYGQPRFIQILGSNIFTKCEESIIHYFDYVNGLSAAINEIGEKFVKPIYDQIRSDDYKSVLVKICEETQLLEFTRQGVLNKLNSKENSKYSELNKKKFDNLIKKLSSLKVIRSSGKGAYVFCDLFYFNFIQLQSQQDDLKIKQRSQYPHHSSTKH